MSLLVIFLSIVVFLLAIISRKQVESSIPRVTLSALVVSAIALLMIGASSLKMVSEIGSNDASRRSAQEQLGAQVGQLNESILSLKYEIDEAKINTQSFVDKLNGGVERNSIRGLRDLRRISKLTAEIAYLQLLAVQSGAETGYLKTYSGSYFVGRHDTVFLPCNLDDDQPGWGVSLHLDEVQRGQTFRLFENSHISAVPVIFTGVLSGEASYGMGNNRLFLVVDVEKRDEESCEYRWNDNLKFGFPEPGYAKGRDALYKGDYATALTELMPDAENGHGYAQHLLGNMYRYGRGVTQNYKTAMKWYKLSAKQGDVAATEAMASIYYEGVGVTQDYVRAHMWWSILLSKGHPSVKGSLRKVEREMTTVQLEEARELAREYIANQNE